MRHTRSSKNNLHIIIAPFTTRWQQLQGLEHIITYQKFRWPPPISICLRCCKKNSIVLTNDHAYYKHMAQYMKLTEK